MIIQCPECGFERTVTKEKIPVGSEFATCPRCATRFRFRIVRDSAPLFQAPPPTKPAEKKSAKAAPPPPWDESPWKSAPWNAPSKKEEPKREERGELPGDAEPDFRSRPGRAAGGPGRPDAADMKGRAEHPERPAWEERPDAGEEGGTAPEGRGRSVFGQAFEDDAASDVAARVAPGAAEEEPKGDIWDRVEEVFADPYDDPSAYARDDSPDPAGDEVTDAGTDESLDKFEDEYFKIIQIDSLPDAPDAPDAPGGGRREKTEHSSTQAAWSRNPLENAEDSGGPEVEKAGTAPKTALPGDDAPGSGTDVAAVDAADREEEREKKRSKRIVQDYVNVDGKSPEQPFYRTVSLEDPEERPKAEEDKPPVWMPVRPGARQTLPGEEPPKTLLADDGSVPWEYSGEFPRPSAFVRTLLLIFSRPVQFFGGISRLGSIVPSLIFALLFLLVKLFVVVGSFELTLLHPDGTQEVAGLMDILGIPLIFVLGTSILVGMMFFTAWLINTSLKFMTTEARYNKTFKIIAYTNAVLILDIVPFVGSILSFVLSCAFLFLGLRSAYRITWGQTVLAVAPFLLFVVIMNVQFLVMFHSAGALPG